MVQIILPVVSDAKKAEEFVKSVKQTNCKFLIGCTEQAKGEIKKKNVSVVMFENGSAKEEIINSLKSNLTEGKVIILRKLISNDELNEFINSPFDITVCATKKRNKISDFFYKIWSKIVSMLFDFKFFDGDVSVTAFSEELSSVVKNISNLSYASRINRWKGVKTGKVQTSSPPAKKEFSRLRANAMLIGWGAVLVAVIASIGVYYHFVPATFLSGFLWTCALLLALLAVLLAVVVYVLNIKTGKRIFKEAKKLEVKNG